MPTFRSNTIKSIKARTDQLFLRNSFLSNNKYGIPVVQKQEIELDNLSLISYSDIKANESEVNRNRGIHFFIDDYRFEGLYDNPERSIKRLSQYKFLLTPDFSLYSEMNEWRQIESIAKSRWCGAFWQSHDLIVIPTISWSTIRSYDYCFCGIEPHSIVAIGMIGCKSNKSNFLRGYREMLSRIQPKAIICLGEPFKEMAGNIIKVNYIESRSK